MYSLILTFLFSMTVLDPLEGFPPYTPDIYRLDATYQRHSLSLRVSGINLKIEDASYILIYVDADNDPITGTHWSRGENPRYMQIGADYMLIEVPDTQAWLYSTPEEGMYQFMGFVPIVFEETGEDSFLTTLLWVIPNSSKVVNLVVFGGSEEFTDDRVPDTGFVRLGKNSPLPSISLLEIKDIWMRRRQELDYREN